MQKIATRIFIIASVAFGIAGLCLVLFGGPNDNAPINRIFMRIVLVCVFVLLPAFSLSIAGRYLKDK